MGTPLPGPEPASCLSGGTVPLNTSEPRKSCSGAAVQDKFQPTEVTQTPEKDH